MRELKQNPDILFNYNEINPQIVLKNHHIDSENNMELETIKTSTFEKLQNAE